MKDAFWTDDVSVLFKKGKDSPHLPQQSHVDERAVQRLHTFRVALRAFGVPLQKQVRLFPVGDSHVFCGERVRESL